MSEEFGMDGFRMNHLMTEERNDHFNQQPTYNQFQFMQPIKLATLSSRDNYLVF